MNRQPSNSADYVVNQPPPLAGYNALEVDSALNEALSREGAGWARPQVEGLGEVVGSERVQELARLANQHVPELRTHDRYGRQIDAVEFHPVYHELMALAFGAGVHSLAWTTESSGGHVARAALSCIWNQAENGVGCPTGMAYAAIPTLRKQANLAADWETKVAATAYDPRPVPIEDKTGATIGMTLTEKQAGSDLRNIVTQAKPLDSAGPGQPYLISGHKWFCSAPMSDALFTLAHTAAGPSFFLVPRSTPDGGRNTFSLQRLKDKCGNRSNASAEVEFANTLGFLIGEEGRGIRIAMESAHFTRLDFAVGSAGLMRRALLEALHHARHRHAFNKALADFPLMQNVLADLAIETEASLLLGLRLARSLDDTETDETAFGLQRIGVPIAKYWHCKRAPGFVAEALECIGGNAFVEEHPMARLYREAPLNGIWEGVGNMICLDVLRSMQRDPTSCESLLGELRHARGVNDNLDRAIAEIDSGLTDPSHLEPEARRFVELTAVALQASLLVRFSPPEVADVFCAQRLGTSPWRTFGTLPRGAALRAIVDRAAPIF